MKRFLVMLAVTALLVSAMAVPAFASALFNTPGINAVGQLKAAENCQSKPDSKQYVNGVRAGGGPKAEDKGFDAGPTNCDHWYQQEDAIGNQEP